MFQSKSSKFQRRRIEIKRQAWKLNYKLFDCRETNNKLMMIVKARKMIIAKE